MFSTFKLSEKQREKVYAWRDNLPKVYDGDMSERLTYSFTPTRLGTIVKVSDICTKEELDLTGDL